MSVGVAVTNGATTAAEPFRSLAWQHLTLELRRLNARLGVAVERQMRHAAQLDHPHVSHLAITDRHAKSMLARIDERVAAEAATTEAVATDNGWAPVLKTELERLRSLARSTTRRLPLDELRHRFGLDDADVFALVVCVAPEIDPAYPRLYAYINDEMQQTGASPGLLKLLLDATKGPSAAGPTTSDQPLGPYQRLRRSRLVVADADHPGERTRPVRPASGLLDYLAGQKVDLGLLDLRPDLVPPPADSTRAPANVAERGSTLGLALAGGAVDVVGVWGRDELDRRDTLDVISAAAGLPYRAITVAGDPEAALQDLRYELQATAVIGGLLVVSLPDIGRRSTLHPDNGDPAAELLSAAVDDLLATAAVPTIIGGPAPWHPPNVLRSRRYAELVVPAATHRQRCELWAAALPGAGPTDVADLAARYRLDRAAIESAAAMARAEVAMSAPDGGQRINGANSTPLRRAVAALARSGSSAFTTAIAPQRTRADLVLPEPEMAQIHEIGRFHRAWPVITERWGFATVSGRGVKALFIGDPGTGKTLAAEVIAADLGVVLVKVELAQVVSKWVGETEKNLEVAFREAEATDCVLFFDEADALFGKRGEVRHGTDRYANLEIGYLLQRLEAYEGIVILASNLHDNIDAAFGRRFQFVVHFPRPEEADRRRLWRQAFPVDTPVESLDIDVLARLDLTGAGIASSAQTAALLAAAEGCDRIAGRHIAHAVRRQFQREGRALRPSDLGPYAAL